VGWSQDGARALVQVPGSAFEVRDTATWQVETTVGPARQAFLSEDGRFVFSQGSDALRILRLADGEELFQVPPDSEGERGLSFTAGGLFDGGPEALRAVAYRVGRDVLHGRLLGYADVTPNGLRPGLAADFFAGKAVGASGP
jgi:hypothetical protein